MKKLIMGILCALALLSAQASADISGFIHLDIGKGNFLEVEANTSAPVVVYDSVVYERHAQSKTILVPRTYQIPVTRVINIPANQDKIILDNEVIFVDPSPQARTMEIVVGIREKTVFSKEIVQQTYYVPTSNPIRQYNSVYYIKPTYRTKWVSSKGLIIKNGTPVYQYYPVRPPSGIVNVGGLWRYKAAPNIYRPVHTYGSKGTVVLPGSVKGKDDDVHVGGAISIPLGDKGHININLKK